MKTGDTVVCVDDKALPEGDEVRQGETYIVESADGFGWLKVNGHWLLSRRFVISTPEPTPKAPSPTDTLRRLILELGAQLDAIDAGEDRWGRVAYVLAMMAEEANERDPIETCCCDTGHGATLTFRGGGTCLPDDLASMDETVGFVWDHAKGEEVPRDPIGSDLKAVDLLSNAEIEYSKLLTDDSPPRDPIGSKNIPAKYQSCPFPGWRYADERDIGKALPKGDCIDRSPNDFPGSFADNGSVLRSINWENEYPYTFGVAWKYAYVKIDTRDPVGSKSPGVVDEGTAPNPTPPTFKVGDRVTVRKLDVHENPFCDCKPMRATEGKTGEVVSLSDRGNPRVRINGQDWYYHPSSLDHARDPIGSKSTRDPIGSKSTRDPIGSETD